MRSFRDRNPYAVGIISTLVIGAITGMAFLVGLLHLLEDSYEMEGSFTDAAGLKSGDDVKLAGVKVGRVTSIEADRAEGLVRVNWVVNTGVDIREGAGADIALETLLGSKFVRITDATAGADLMADLPTSERSIPVERTTTPVDIFDLTRDATIRIEATDNERLNQLVIQLADITEGKRGTVTDLISSVDQLATAINEREVQLDDLLASADELAANLPDLNRALALAGPAFYGQSLAGTHGPWQDIYVAALGPDVIGVLEGVIP